MAMSPWSAVSHSSPSNLIRLCATFWLIGLSSTSNTRPFIVVATASLAAGGSMSANSDDRAVPPPVLMRVTGGVAMKALMAVRISAEPIVRDRINTCWPSLSSGGGDSWPFR